MSSTDSYNDEQILRGTQQGQMQVFKNGSGQDIKVISIVIDFYSLMMSNNTSVDVVKGVGNRELLHAVVALYDVSLCDMTPDALYFSICKKMARTVILLRDIDGTLQDMKARYEKRLAKASGSTNLLINNSAEAELKNKQQSKEQISVDAANDGMLQYENDADVFHPDETKPCTFAEVFSDSEEEENASDNDDVEEEDFSKGINTFLKKVIAMKKQLFSQAVTLTTDNIRIENRLVAAMTFEKKSVKSADNIIHLTLLAVRKRLQKCGIGQSLLKCLKDPSFSGHFDAVVVHAENTAVAFFRRNGFSDDIVLNKRWSDVAEQYTHCTLMCYLPPFTRDFSRNTLPELDLVAMETEIEKWRSRCAVAYQAEMSCVSRMRQEIIQLRALVGSQQEVISRLMAKNGDLQLENFILEKKFLQHRLETATARLGLRHQSDSDSEDFVVEEK